MTGLCGRGHEFIEKVYYTQTVDWSRYRITRAGVIPYTVINNHLFFCLGVDRRHNELTDFGGTVQSTDESPLAGAIREFREESKEVFGPENYHAGAFANSQCLIKKLHGDRHMMIIFLEVDPSYLHTAIPNFLERDISTRDEVSAIDWFNSVAFREMIYTKRTSRMYDKVKKFIASCVSFNRLHYSLLVNRALVQNNPHFVKVVPPGFEAALPWLPAAKVSTFRRRRSLERKPRCNLSNYRLAAAN